MEKFVGKIYRNLLTKKFVGVFIYICQIFWYSVYVWFVTKINS
jgi:hypothetical protein